MAINGVISVIDAFTLIATVSMCRTALIQLPVVIAALSHARIAFLSGDEYGQVLLEVDSSYDHCTAPSPLAAPAGGVSVRRTDCGLAVVS